MEYTRVTDAEDLLLAIGAWLSTTGKSMTPRSPQDELEQRLAAAQLKQAPFPHWVMHRILTDEVISALSTCLKQAKWTFTTSSFYSQDVSGDLTDLVNGTAADFILRPETTELLRRYMENMFGIELSAYKNGVNVHRLLPGYRIGPHTDCPGVGGETESHRLLIFVQGSPEYSGGELVLFDPSDLEGTAVLYAPEHNCAVALEFSAKSWHSVNEVEEGERYTLSFSFWRKPYESLSRKELPDANIKEPVIEQPTKLRYEQLVLLLKSFGGESMVHSGRTLLAHLEGTAAILEHWNCVKDICIAGLLHTVFGTRSFPMPFPELSPPELREMVGERTYWLIQFYSNLDIDLLLGLLTGLQSSIGGRTLSAEDLSGLVHMFWANELDQAGHVIMTEQHLSVLRLVYEHSRGLLNRLQKNDINHLINLQNVVD